MKVPIATCAICDEPICLELANPEDLPDQARLQRELELLAETHLRTHPAPVQARFWLRRFLDDIPPSERPAAVGEIYRELLRLWGDQDRRGTYTIDEVLGSAAVYRLWLDTDRCAHAACPHGEDQPDRSRRPPGPAGGRWHRLLLGRVLAPPAWHGTQREWRQLVQAVGRNCRCTANGSPPAACGAHRLLAEPRALARLVFARRIAGRLRREEFDDPAPRSLLLTVAPRAARLSTLASQPAASDSGSARTARRREHRA
jgi:hypothetical protein